MWHPDDGATRLKMVDIYLREAAAHLGKREYARAEQRIRDAKLLKFDAVVGAGRTDARARGAGAGYPRTVAAPADADR